MSTSTETSSYSRPQRDRRLPYYLSDYELEVDFRKNYDNDVGKKKTVNKVEKTAKRVAKQLNRVKVERKQRQQTARAAITQPITPSKKGSAIPTWVNPLDRFATTRSAADAHNRFREYQSAGINEEEALRILLNQSLETSSLKSQIVKGINCKEKWAISSLDRTVAHYSSTIGDDMSVSIDQVLNSCSYHPGKIHNPFKKPTVEIVFTFDTTGSMFKAVNELKQKLQRLLHQLLTDLPDIRIAIIAHGDYCDSEMYYTMSKLDFSNDINTLVEFIQTITMCGGGDPEECYEMALKECSALNWFKTNDDYPEDISRVVVLIGDDIPHESNQYFNIDWRSEVKNLFETLCVKIYGVQCLGRDYASAFYQELADATYGTRLELDSFSRMNDLISGLCYRESAEQASVLFAKSDSAPSTSTSASESTEPTALSNGILSDEDIMSIHYALHSESVNSVNVQGEEYEISTNTAESRHVRVHDIAYIEQNKSKTTKYALMAREGHKITWITKKGVWGLIIDDEIIRR